MRANFCVCFRQILDTSKIHLHPHPEWLKLLSLLRSWFCCCCVVDSLFIAAFTVFGGSVFGPCFGIQ